MITFFAQVIYKLRKMMYNIGKVIMLLFQSTVTKGKVLCAITKKPNSKKNARQLP